MPPARWTETSSSLKELSKSGITALVFISVLGGYLCVYPLERPFDFAKALWVTLGVYLLASGSSALNQIQERHEDARMPRTAKRPLPSGRLSLPEALGFTLITAAAGLLILGWVGPKELILGLIALLSYNGLYTLWWKRHLPYAAIPGAIPGAIPIWIGAIAATGEWITPAGLYLFAVLFFWQMPHFWVLALNYKDDYAAGGFPTLPVAHGPGVTRLQIQIWCLAYCALLLSGAFFLKTGVVTLATALGLSAKLIWEMRAYSRGARWIRFFLWVTFSIVIFLAGAAIDHWGVYLAAHILG